MLNSTQQLQTERELKVAKKIKTIKIHTHQKKKQGIRIVSIRND